MVKIIKYSILILNMKLLPLGMIFIKCSIKKSQFSQILFTWYVC
jgi:hypothetical protein